MQIQLAFVLSFISLAFGIGSGVFFFMLWQTNGRTNNFLIKSAIAVFLMYLFQLPFILANGGVHFVQNRFNAYFLFAFIANFSGLVLIFFIVKQVLKKIPLKTILAVLIGWYAFCILNFIFSLLIPFKAGIERPGIIFGACVLFIPIRLVIISSLSAVWDKTIFKNMPALFWGGSLIQFGLTLNLINYFFTLRQILFYPKDLWFIAIVDDKALLLTGIIASIFLVVGLLYFFSHTKKENNFNNLLSN